MTYFNVSVIHPSWNSCFYEALAKIDPTYLKKLAKSNRWLPGRENIFNAFSIPLHSVNYILLGESPYPRAKSANGYAFWDANVNELWSEKGLSKTVNRATSLRNIMKLLFSIEQSIAPHQVTQSKIASTDKSDLIQTNGELFAKLLKNGFLLLNATPVLQLESKPQYDAKMWLPFIKTIITCLIKEQPKVTLLLLGKIAQTIDRLLPDTHINKIYAEHPYNLSFISNPKIIEFFRQFNLLRKI